MRHRVAAGIFCSSCPLLLGHE
ncbi:MAG: hypothetical protein LBP38_01770 [Desulfovibrio sp.]|nr:hypothetical protein [Desulfovibrio sp.]